MTLAEKLKAEESLIDLQTLISQLKNKINIPIIAAGGMMNKKDIAAMLAAGAAGVQMGTAFLSCHESGAHPPVHVGGSISAIL